MKRPAVLAGSTARVRMGCGNLYLTVNTRFGDPVEIFARLGKGGACQGALLQALGRTISIALQAGAPADQIASTLEGISCPEAAPGEPGTRPCSCADALSKLLRSYDEERNHHV